MIDAPLIDPRTASAEIDLDALVTNIVQLQRHVAPAEVMVVVKADGYGHGMVRCARAARAAGTTWLGVATPSEAMALRESGDEGRLLAWLYGPEEDLSPLVAADVDVSAQSVDQISTLAAAAGIAERRARVHLKVDTGLSRNGAPLDQWPEVCAAAAEAQEAGALEVVAVWSHFSSADEPGAPSVPLQQDRFEAAYAQAQAAGLKPELRHLGNSAGALIVPQAHYDLVRVGIAAYGIEPAPGLAALAGVPLRPVMRLRAQLANVKQIPAGAGVSYGLTWVTEGETTVGLVPLGYGDGVPRQASNRAQVSVGDGRAKLRGNVCMDQFVVELGPDSDAAVGDEVTVFGAGDHGEPTAADWAEWCDTIGYEIVTRIGSRVPRVYVGGEG
ncbi:MAG: alanine racemase [Propionibacteriaceae bacterium]